MRSREGAGSMACIKIERACRLDLSLKEESIHLNDALDDSLGGGCHCTSYFTVEKMKKKLSSV